jgi:hypothetical protein
MRRARRVSRGWWPACSPPPPPAAAADAAGTFEFLARYYDGRFSRAAALLEGAVVPAMVFFFAFFVASAALGMFLPLVDLMNRVGELSGFN